jgi:hypothetical protein
MLAPTAPMPSARRACCGQAPEPRSGAPQAQGLRAARLAEADWRGPSSHSDRTLSERSNTDFYSFERHARGRFPPSSSRLPARQRRPETNGSGGLIAFHDLACSLLVWLAAARLAHQPRRAFSSKALPDIDHPGPAQPNLRRDRLIPSGVCPDPSSKSRWAAPSRTAGATRPAVNGSLHRQGGIIGQARWRSPMTCRWRSSCAAGSLRMSTCLIRVNLNLRQLKSRQCGPPQ